MSDDLYQKHRGITVRTNEKNRWRVVFLHYSADPDKTEAWAAKERKTYSDVEAWNREMEIDFASTTGVKVYPQFRRDIHLRPLKHVSSRPIWRGWDFGYGHPACVWAQVSDNGVLCVLREHMAISTTIQDFAGEVIDISEKFYAGCSFFDAGDPAVRMTNDKSEKTSADILRQAGVRIQTRPTLIKTGVNTIRQMLLPRYDGLVRLVVDEKCCPVLTEGFLGGYGLDDQDDPEPVKDGYYDHLADSLRYLVVVLFDSVKANPIIPGRVWAPNRSVISPTGY